MKLFIVLMLFSISASADNFFIALKMGYKFEEPDKFTIGGVDYDADYGHVMGTHVRAGYKWNNCIYKWLTCASGLSHDSQLLSTSHEYFKSEVYLEVEVNLSEFFK